MGQINNVTIANHQIIVNGKAVEGNVVPFDKMKKENEIVVVMG